MISLFIPKYDKFTTQNHSIYMNITENTQDEVQLSLDHKLQKRLLPASYNTLSKKQTSILATIIKKQQSQNNVFKGID